MLLPHQCQWQMFFTFFMAYVLTSDTFGLNVQVSDRDAGHTLVSTLLMLLTFAMLGFGIYKQYQMMLEKKRVAAEKAALLAENKKLADEMDDFRKNACNIVGVRQSMSIESRRKFLFGDWASPVADMTPEERIAAAKGAELDTAGVKDDAGQCQPKWSTLEWEPAVVVNGLTRN